ncbi:MULTISPECIES: hypothetical protein [unclassified Bradyrhizobium]|uniref:hypothetical protein n=1 Tax=unclassified Bradyrhizobium TaxID=2631580 RepID=UPI001FF882FE|nr:MULTISPECIES: hypothetical protein [unclassified Bradyrhizobium]MCK1708860.1 hypothetical protein [Bradyrhizobium sp. 143]MCK1727856.1 hypothetical protein [Bradyrhizobium sp. 142]
MKSFQLRDATLVISRMEKKASDVVNQNRCGKIPNTRRGHSLPSAILANEEWHQLFKDFRPKAINLPGKRIAKPCGTRMDSRSVRSHFGSHAIYDHPTCQDLSVPFNSATTTHRHGNSKHR